MVGELPLSLNLQHNWLIHQQCSTMGHQSVHTTPLHSSVAESRSTRPRLRILRTINDLLRTTVSVFALAHERGD